MSNRAGSSSHRKFREERRKQIRADWRRLVVSCAIAIALLAWMLLTEGWSRTIAAFCLGGVVTGLWFGWMLGFNARSLTWAWGAWGEEFTAEELEKLGDEWRVYHDIPDGAGNWDHVVVGPGGVYVIDTKNLSGPVRLGRDGLHAGRLRLGGSAARGSAARMKELIEERAGVVVWVQGVLAVWGGFEAAASGAVERERVLYVRGRDLVEMLRSRPVKLGESQRRSVGEALEAVTAKP